MAEGLDATSLLSPQPQQSLQGYGIGSPAFQQADAFTLKHEGGATRNDGIGHTANQGVDQNAHPDVNVLALTPQQTQAIRHQYWTAVNGDALAQRDPRLALVAYETAIASGPAVANKMLAQSGGDVNQLMQLRVNFMNGLVQRDPEKFGAVAQGWANRNRDLAAAAGLDPTQFGLPAGGQRAISFAPQAQAQPLDASLTQSRPLNAPLPDWGGDKAAQDKQVAAALGQPAGGAQALPALTPAPIQAAPAQGGKELYLDLLKRRQALPYG